jgi:hypothetical protein
MINESKHSDQYMYDIKPLLDETNNHCNTYDCDMVKMVMVTNKLTVGG